MKKRPKINKYVKQYGGVNDVIIVISLTNIFLFN